MESHKCKFCSKTFSDTEILNFHENHHKNKNIFKCKKCNKCFDDIDKLFTHTFEHLKILNCKNCFQTFNLNVKLNIHQKSCNEKKSRLECDICGKKSLKAILHLEHIKSHSSAQDTIVKSSPGKDSMTASVSEKIDSIATKNTFDNDSKSKINNSKNTFSPKLENSTKNDFKNKIVANDSKKSSLFKDKTNDDDDKLSINSDDVIFKKEKLTVIDLDSDEENDNFVETKTSDESSVKNLESNRSKINKKFVKSDVVTRRSARNLVNFCDKCQIQFNDKNELIAHYITKHNYLNDNLQVNATIVQKEIKNENPSLKNAKVLRVVQNNSFVPQDNSPMYICKMCDMKFFSENLLNEHNQMYHSLISKPKPVRNYGLAKANDIGYYDQNGNITCQKCYKTFESFKQVRRHYYTLHTTKPYHCPHCSVGFMYRQSLRHHLRLKHNIKNILPALLENKANQQSSSLNVSNSSTGNKQINLERIEFQSRVCIKCNNRQFKTLDQLARHKRLFHQFKPFKCPLCDQRFLVKQNIKKHYKRYHQNDSYDPQTVEKFQNDNSTEIQQNNEDDVVEKMNQQPNLIVENNTKSFGKKGPIFRKILPKPIIRNQTDKILITCGVCNKKFQSRQIFKQHILSHQMMSHRQPNVNFHPRQRQRFTIGIPGGNVVKFANARYQCTICDASFTQKCNLDRHYKTLHSTNLIEAGHKYLCLKCLQVFTDFSFIKNHRVNGDCIDQVKDTLE